MTKTITLRLAAPMAGVLLLGACANSLPYDPDFRGILGGGLSTTPDGSTTTSTSSSGQVTDGFSGQGVESRAPSDMTTATTTTTTTPAQTHTVARGETAYSLARKYGVTLQALAAANDLSESMSLRVGQVLTIPATTTTSSSATSAPGTGSETPVPPSASAPLPQESTVAASTPVAAPSNDLGSSRTSASTARLQMPVSGSIARAYSKGSNDGIDIAAPAGSTVKAAASGTVAAITKDTDQVPIVVIRHSDGLMTVYANVDGVSVSKGATVSKGQSIAKARGGAVHFEVRQGFDSVDPMTYL